MRRYMASASPYRAPQRSRRENPRGRDLRVELERERGDAHAEAAEQGRPIQADVAPRSEVVAPEQCIHRA